MKSILFALLGFMIVAGPVFANSDLIDEMAQEESVDTTDGVSSPDGANHGTSWRFLGCVHNYDPEHECEHTAHARGYWNHFAQHDHYRCGNGEHSFACYGRR